VIILSGDFIRPNERLGDLEMAADFGRFGCVVIAFA
jgi:hypothetical protein